MGGFPGHGPLKPELTLGKHVFTSGLRNTQDNNKPRYSVEGLNGSLAPLGGKSVRYHMA